MPRYVLLLTTFRIVLELNLPFIFISGVLVPKVNRCFEVEPFGKTFFKLEKRKHHSW